MNPQELNDIAYLLRKLGNDVLNWCDDTEGRAEAGSGKEQPTIPLADSSPSQPQQEAEGEKSFGRLAPSSSDLLDRLIDDVVEHTFADLPWHGKIEPEQPELGIDDLTALREQMTETIREWVREIFKKKEVPP